VSSQPRPEPDPPTRDDPSTRNHPPTRDDVIAMLASYRDRPPEQVREKLDSLELAWLVHQVEQRYGVVLDLEDDVLARMSTITGAVEALGELLVESAHG
jgi:acyl carrier protein